jgi:hypothetical protein
LPASSCQSLLSTTLPVHVPHLVHPVVLVVVPVVPCHGFPLVVIGAWFRQLLLGCLACFLFPSLALMTSPVFVMVVLILLIVVIVLSSFTCVLLACLVPHPTLHCSHGLAWLLLPSASFP